MQQTTIVNNYSSILYWRQHYNSDTLCIISNAPSIQAYSCKLLSSSKDMSYDDKMFLPYEWAGFLTYKHTIHGALPIVWFVKHHFGKWSKEEGFLRRIEE